MRVRQVQTREPSFLENERTPASVRRSVARLKFCTTRAQADETGGGKDGGGRDGCIGGSASGGADVMHLPGSTPPAELLKALRSGVHATARVLRVQHISSLALPEAGLDSLALSEATSRSTGGGATGGAVGATGDGFGGGLLSVAGGGLLRLATGALGAGGSSGPVQVPTNAVLEKVTRGFWCTACPVSASMGPPLDLPSIQSASWQKPSAGAASAADAPAPAAAAPAGAAAAAAHSSPLHPAQPRPLVR